MVDPAQIERTLDQRRRLAQFAERSGRVWTELIDDWLNASASPAPASAPMSGDSSSANQSVNGTDLNPERIVCKSLTLLAGQRKIVVAATGSLKTKEIR
jgi:hypothetical protein